MAEQEYAELKVRDQKLNLPIYNASIGAGVIDIRKLFSQSGYFAYDPGFMSTASCTSAITFIDGAKGILKHRGYSIEYLAEHHNFLEVAHLLIFGQLPSDEELAIFDKELRNNTAIDKQISNIFAAFRQDAHPMCMVLSVIGALASIYHETIDLNDPKQRDEIIIKILAKMPTIAALAYRHSIGKGAIEPDAALSFTDNFVQMMFGSAQNENSKLISKALDKIFILHADHEQNASTSTMRIVGSSKANPFACISAAVASLWGPAHGGANEAVIKMLKQIEDVSQIPGYLARAKDKEDPFKLMGFGHRVYKNFDPRANALKATCYEVLDKLNSGNEEHMLHIAKELAAQALEDEYFASRKLYPNVDYYSGIIYSAMGIAPGMFTVLFAVARTAGWLAQWREMHEAHLKISRPRQLYVGKNHEV